MTPRGSSDARVSLGSGQVWDRWLLAASLTLAAVSVTAMVSATTQINPVLAKRHALWMLLGILASVGIARIPSHRLTDAAALAYGISLAALLLVELAGTMRLGATRWLSVFGFSLQPSEFAKLTTVWMLAQQLTGEPTPISGRALWASVLLAGLPAAMIFLQPDLGSASIMLAIWLGMVWVAGLSRGALLGMAACALVALPVAWHFLRDYQRDRLLVFINPQVDPLGAGYTIIQSIIAVGSGQLFGRGWRAGTQNQLSFLPERHSDFIYSVIGEEWGLIGGLLVVAAFAVLLFRGLRIAQEAATPYGRLLAAGIVSWLGYQAVVNLGMVIGLLPVVGVPLPFVSYGGSAMVTAWVALGLLQGIRRTDLG